MSEVVDPAKEWSVRRYSQQRRGVPLPSYLYFLKCEQFLKIGITDWLPHRLTILQVGNPFPLEVLATIKYPDYLTAANAESASHQRFGQLRVRGEWFRYEGELRDYVEALGR